MDRYFVGAGLFAVAAALFLVAVAPARAATGTYTQCVVLKTDFANDVKDINGGAVLTIPEGWQPIGGGAVPKGMQYVGVVVLCK